MRKYIGIYTRLFRRKALSFSLSNMITHTNTHTNQAVRITAVLHAHRLTDDGMHLVLQTGSTAYM